MVRLVLFDIDGTLIHTSGAGEKAFGRVFSNLFGIADGTERLKFAGRTDPSIVREFFVHNAIEPSQENYERFFEAYVFMLDHMLQELPGGVHRGVWTWLHDLRTLPQKPAVGLLTGNVRLAGEIKLRRFNLWEQFDFGGFADDSMERNEIAAISKHRGEAFLKRKLDPKEVLVIGDTPLDVTCARHIGAKVIAVGTGIYRANDLQQFAPDYAVDNLEQINAREICG
jgi:phosphoglycolate phosphatase